MEISSFQHQQQSSASTPLMTLAEAAAVSTAMSTTTNSTYNSLFPATSVPNAPLNPKPRVIPPESFYSQLAREYDQYGDPRFVGPDFQRLIQRYRERETFANLDYQKLCLKRTLELLLSENVCDAAHPMVRIYKDLLGQLRGALPHPNLFQPIIRFDSRGAFYCELHHQSLELPFGAKELVEWIRYVDLEVVHLSSAIYSLLYHVYETESNIRLAPTTSRTVQGRHGPSNRGFPNYSFAHGEEEEGEELPSIIAGILNSTSRKRKDPASSRIPASKMASTPKNHFANQNAVLLKKQRHEPVCFSPTLDEHQQELNPLVSEFQLKSQDIDDQSGYENGSVSRHQYGSKSTSSLKKVFSKDSRLCKTSKIPNSYLTLENANLYSKTRTSEVKSSKSSMLASTLQENISKPLKSRKALAEHNLSLLSKPFSDTSAASSVQVEVKKPKCRNKSIPLAPSSSANYYASPTPCETCGKILANRQSYQNHTRRHLGIKPYACTWLDCGYETHDRSLIYRHVRQSHFGLPRSVKTQRQRGLQDDRNPNDFIEIRTNLLKMSLVEHANGRVGGSS